MSKIVTGTIAFLVACLAITVIFSGLPNTVNAAASVAASQRIPTVNDPEVNYLQDGTPNFNDDSVQMILARAIFGEARGESKKGKIGVGWVIRNRADNPRWWGNSYHTAILKEQRGIFQFNALNPNDANYRSVIDPFQTSSQSDKNAWYECYEIAGQILSGNVDDPTKGADHFFSIDIPTPFWADKEKFTVQIGKHKFYRLELSAPKETPPPEVPKQNLIQEVIAKIEKIIPSIQGVIGTIQETISSIQGEIGKSQKNISFGLGIAAGNIILFVGAAITGLIFVFLVRFLARVFFHSGNILSMALSFIMPIGILVFLYYLYEEEGMTEFYGGVLGVIIGIAILIGRLGR